MWLCEAEPLAAHVSLESSVLEKCVGFSVGPELSWSHLWIRYLAEQKPLSEILLSKIVCHALYQRCLGAIGAQVYWNDSVWDAVCVTEKVLESGNVREKIWMSKMNAAEWDPMPQASQHVLKDPNIGVRRFDEVVPLDLTRFKQAV